jgi:hypothetical protein
MTSLGPFRERADKQLTGWSFLVLLLAFAGAQAIATRITSASLSKLPAAIVGLGALGLFSWWHRRRHAPGDVMVSPRGVMRGDELLVPSAEVEQALVRPAPNGKTSILEVRTRRAAAPRRFETPDVNVAREALRALGRDPAVAAVTMRARSRTFAASSTEQAVLWASFVLVVVTSFFLGAWTGHGDSKSVMFFYGLVGITPFIVLNNLGSTATVGTDGVTTRWLGMDRFVSHRDIVGVELEGGNLIGTRFRAVRLRLASGKTFSVAFAPGPDADAFVERLSGALAAYRSRARPVDLSLLSRGTRSHAAWVDHLRAVAHGATAGPRTAVVDPDRLLAVVADPSQPEVVRASAAVAVGRSLGDGERVRVRAIAAASASPKLRVALEHASRDDADAADLAEALAELEAGSMAR